MNRLLGTILLLAIFLAGLPSPVAAQSSADEQAAAATAEEISWLESTGDFNSVYDRIHPDAHAIIPRAAVIGWYQNDFGPLGPGVATVTGVRFVEWTWPVTGQAYPYTAEVSFRQPFANGTVAEDVVRLVQDGSGEWRWFFGRSREFIEEQIAKYAPPPPVVSNVSIFDVVITDLNTYWSLAFAASGQPYTPPNVVAIETIAYSSCDAIDPYISPAAYCSLDQTIYFSPSWFSDVEYAIGDFAWITIMAHEWGHHVQALDGAYLGVGNQHELQADCLAGSYGRDAETRGLLDPGDITEAILISATFGDPIGLPQDSPGAHGTNDDRVTAFMRGYLDGFIGCGFLFMDSPSPATTTQPAMSQPDLLDLLPLQQEIPSDLGHAGDQRRSLAEVVINYTDPAETERLFTLWGWEENVTRGYEGNGRSSGVTSVYVSIHRFGSASDAAWALDYSLLDQAASTGAWDVSVAPLGATTRALATGSDVTIYVQQGDLMIRLTVAATEADQLSTAQSIMQSILERAT